MRGILRLLGIVAVSGLIGAVIAVSTVTIYRKVLLKGKVEPVNVKKPIAKGSPEPPGSGTNEERNQSIPRPPRDNRADRDVQAGDATNEDDGELDGFKSSVGRRRTGKAVGTIRRAGVDEARNNRTTHDYIVRPGDNLYQIARQENASVEQIVSDNNLQDDHIEEGQKLVIRGAQHGRRRGGEQHGQAASTGATGDAKVGRTGDTPDLKGNARMDRNAKADSEANITPRVNPVPNSDSGIHQVEPKNESIPPKKAKLSPRPEFI